MKKGRDPHLLRNDDGSIFGVLMHGNAYAEHEHGIKGINRTLKISAADGLKGIEAYRVGKCPEDSIAIGDFDGWKVLFFDSYGMAGRFLDGVVQALGLIRGKDIEAAWSSESFAIALESAEGREFLSDLHGAFLNNDAGVWLGRGVSSSPFSRGGLVVVIISRVTEEDRKKIFGQ